MPNPILLNSNYITIGVGQWQLVWDSIDPQQLPLRQIRIACDTTIGSMIITLPPAATEQAKNVELFFCSIGNGGGVLFHRHGSDTINGHPAAPPLTLQYQIGIYFNAYGANWTVRSLR